MGSDRIWALASKQKLWTAIHLLKKCVYCEYSHEVQLLSTLTHTFDLDWPLKEEIEPHSAELTTQWGKLLC